MSYITAHFMKVISFLNLAWYLPLVVALGVYSITRLIVEDTIADDLRNKLFDRWPHDGYTTKNRPKHGTFQVISQGQYYVTEGTKIGELFACPWCMGFWVSTLVCIGILLSPIWTLIVLAPFAIRVLPGIIHTVVSR